MIRLRVRQWAVAKIDLKTDVLLANLEQRVRQLELAVAEELTGGVHAVRWNGEALCDLVHSAYGGYNTDQPYTPVVLPETEVEPGVWVEAEALKHKVVVLVRVQRGLRQEQKLVSVPTRSGTVPARDYSYREWEMDLQEAYRWCVLAIGQQRRLAMERAEAGR